MPQGRGGGGLGRLAGASAVRRDEGQQAGASAVRRGEGRQSGACAEVSVPGGG